MPTSCFGDIVERSLLRAGLFDIKCTHIEIVDTAPGRTALRPGSFAAQAQKETLPAYLAPKRYRTNMSAASADGASVTVCMGHLRLLTGTNCAIGSLGLSFSQRHNVASYA